MNFLLNELVDILEKEEAAKSDPESSSPSEKTANGPTNGQANGVRKEPLVTWVHKNFQVLPPVQFTVVQWLNAERISFSPSYLLMFVFYQVAEC